MYYLYLQERIYSIIEKNVNNGKILQKRNKGNSLRFQFLPSNNVHAKTENSSNNNDHDKGPLWLGIAFLVIIIAKYYIWRKFYSSKVVKDDEKKDAQHIEYYND